MQLGQHGGGPGEIVAAANGVDLVPQLPAEDFRSFAEAPGVPLDLAPDLRARGFAIEEVRDGVRGAAAGRRTRDSTWASPRS